MPLSSRYGRLQTYISALKHEGRTSVGIEYTVRDSQQEDGAWRYRTVGILSAVLPGKHNVYRGFEEAVRLAVHYAKPCDLMSVITSHPAAFTCSGRITYMFRDMARERGIGRMFIRHKERPRFRGTPFALAKGCEKDIDVGRERFIFEWLDE